MGSYPRDGDVSELRSMCFLCLDFRFQVVLHRKIWHSITIPCRYTYLMANEFLRSRITLQVPLIDMGSSKPGHELYYNDKMNPIITPIFRENSIEGGSSKRNIDLL